MPFRFFSSASPVKSFFAKFVIEKFDFGRSLLEKFIFARFEPKSDSRVGKDKNDQTDRGDHKDKNHQDGRDDQKDKHDHKGHDGHDKPHKDKHDHSKSHDGGSCDHDDDDDDEGGGGVTPAEPPCPTVGPVGENKLVGTSTADILTGLADHTNFIVGNAGDDVITGGDYNDQILGNRGADQIYGGCGDDIIFLGADNDTVDGGHGNDRINADSGANLMTGGTGSDTFVFYDRGFDVAGADTITDFTLVVDQIEFTDIAASRVIIQQDGTQSLILVDGVVEIIVLNTNAEALAADITYLV